MEARFHMDNEIGVFVRNQDGRPDFDWLDGFGVKVCQVSLRGPANWSDDLADFIREEAGARGVRVVGAFAGWQRDDPPRPGAPSCFAENMKRAAETAKRAGIPTLLTEPGFLPQYISDPLFEETAAVFRDIARHLADLGMQFWFETTEEKPVALLRLIRAIGADNVGVNFDPGNLTIYGTANPLEALEIYGPLVRNVHAKDGFLPTDPFHHGEQIIVGQGRVDFPAVFRKLKELEFTGEIIIEREIRGEQQRLDIIETIRHLKELLPGI